MKNISLFLILAAAPLFHISASAADCHGQTTSCWSACDQAFVPVAGDTCDTYWNSRRKCFDVRGSCGGSSDPHPGDPCRGESTSCWSACDNSFVRQENADSCTTAWNGLRNCFEGIGYCSKR